MYLRLSAETLSPAKIEKCNSLSSGPAHAQLRKLNHMRKSTSVKHAKSLGARLSNVKHAESLGARLSSVKHAKSLGARLSSVKHAKSLGARLWESLVVVSFSFSSSSHIHTHQRGFPFSYFSLE